MSELTRTYVCPTCGYDGFKASAPRSPVDVNVQFYCPACATARGSYVRLVETSDPRDGGRPGEGTPP